MTMSVPSIMPALTGKCPQTHRQQAVTRAKRKCHALLIRTGAWQAVKAIADRLERAGSLNEDEAEDLLQHFLGSGWLSSGRQL